MDQKNARPVDTERLRRRLTWQIIPEREKAEAAVREAYRAAGLPPPRHIEWAGGPKDVRRLLARVGWRAWVPWAVLGVALLAIGIELGLSGPGAWRPVVSDDRLGDALGSIMTIALALGVLLIGTEWHRRTAPPVVQAGWWIYSFALLGLLLTVPDLLRVAPVSILVGGAVVVPVLALLAERHFGGSRGMPLRAGSCVNRSLDRMLRRVARDPEPLLGLDDPPHRMAIRGEAFVRLLRGLLPWGTCPAEILLLRGWAMARRTADEPMPATPEARRAALDLLESVDALWAFSRVAVILAPPERAYVDEQGRFHYANGAAIRWRDGCEVFAVDGEVVRDHGIIFDPDRITVGQIRMEPNPSLRRVLVERYGPERLMRAIGGRRVARDDTGELWRADEFDGEPLVMVRVVNSTPEPDGSHRVYWLRVPPQVARASEGVAWTFGLDSVTYRPAMET